MTSHSNLSRKVILTCVVMSEPALSTWDWLFLTLLDFDETAEVVAFAFLLWFFSLFFSSPSLSWLSAWSSSWEPSSKSAEASWDGGGDGDRGGGGLGDLGLGGGTGGGGVGSKWRSFFFWLFFFPAMIEFFRWWQKKVGKFLGFFRFDCNSWITELNWWRM